MAKTSLTNFKSNDNLVQATLFDSPTFSFDGYTYDPAKDGERLATLQQRVMRTMASGHWYTLRALQAICGGSETSISARIRDCRKSRWGNRVIETRRTAEPGVWEYRMK